MAHTYHQVLVHIVFSTKDRLNLIDETIRDRLHAYMATVVKNEGYGHVLRVGGPADHVHLLVDVAMTGAIADMVRTMKSTASGWVTEQFRLGNKFAWQTGYGAFSVSASLRDKVLAYIDGQEEHHRRRTFRQEYLALLRKHGIEYDERYVLD